MDTDEESTANEATFVAVVMTLVLPTAYQAFIVILTEALVVVLALGLVTHTDLHDRGRHGALAPRPAPTRAGQRH